MEKQLRVRERRGLLERKESRLPQSYARHPRKEATPELSLRARATAVAHHASPTSVCAVTIPRGPPASALLPVNIIVAGRRLPVHHVLQRLRGARDAPVLSAATIGDLSAPLSYRRPPVRPPCWSNINARSPSIVLSNAWPGSPGRGRCDLLPPSSLLLHVAGPCLLPLLHTVDMVALSYHHRQMRLPSRQSLTSCSSRRLVEI